MFPDRSNSAAACSPTYQDRSRQPIGVGSRAGSSAAHGSPRAAAGSSSPASTTPGTPSRSTSVRSSELTACRTWPAVQPVHHCRSDRGAGPNAASHRRASSDRAAAAVRSARSGDADQVNCMDVHPPRGRPRTISPSADSSVSSRLVRFTAPPLGLSAAAMIGVRSRGSSLASSAPVAEPRAARARTVPSAASLSQVAASGAMPASATTWVSWRRSRSAIWSVQAAWMTGVSAAGTTNTVRRMPSIRTSERSSYRACSIAALSTEPVRARADRYTDAGSVPCSAMMPSTAAATAPARSPGARWCRTASRARRSATLTAMMPPAMPPTLPKRRPGGWVPRD